MLRRAILLCFLIALPVGGASTAPAPTASAPSDAAKAMAGKWEFSNADRDKVCSIVFRTDPSAAGMKLEFDPACYGFFPFIKEVVGWRLNDNDFLRLLNAKGKSVLEFNEVENRMFEAPRPGEGILFIQSLAAVVPDVTVEQMNGDWTIVRGSGKTICTLSFSGTAVGDSFALKLNPGCEPFVSRFNPVSWRIDRGALTLSSARGDTWLFEADDPTNWHRIPQTADPVLLVRK
jgi:Protease inhibitor Inh